MSQRESYVASQPDIEDDVDQRQHNGNVNELPASPDDLTDNQLKHEETVVTEFKERKAPDRGWAWFVCLGGFLVHFIIGGFERSNGVIYLQLLSRFNRSATATAWVLSIFSTLRLVLGPVASAICNRFSCRFVVMLGAAISALGVLSSGFVTDISYMYITYGILCGVGRALVYTPGVIAVGLYFNKRRGVAVGIATSGIGFGCFLIPPTVELLFDHYGFFGAFLVLSAVISNFFICGAFFRPLELHWKLMEFERKKTNGKMVREKLVSSNKVADVIKSPHLGNGGNTDPKLTQQERTGTAKSSKRKLSQQFLKVLKPNTTSSRDRKPLLNFSLFKNFAFCALCLQIFLFTMSINITSLFLPALAQEKGISNIEAAYLVSIIGICDGTCRIIISTILDLKRVKPYRLLIYNCVMFLTAIVFFLLPSVSNFSELVVICGLYGMLSGTYMSQKSVVIIDVLGVANLASSFGFLMLAQGLSNLIGSTVGGLFKDFLGNYDITFYFAAVGIILGALAMTAGNIWLYKKKRNGSCGHN